MYCTLKTSIKTVKDCISKRRLPTSVQCAHISPPVISFLINYYRLKTSEMTKKPFFPIVFF